MIFPNIKAKETDKLELNSLKEIGWDFEKDEPLFKDNNFVVVEDFNPRTYVRCDR